MIPIQLELELHATRFEVHKRENNKESQANLKASKDRFNRKCSEVFDMLMEGQELTVLGCAIKGISSLPRRCLDLKQKGVKISDRWENGIKIYFMSNNDKNFNSAL